MPPHSSPETRIISVNNGEHPRRIVVVMIVQPDRPPIEIAVVEERDVRVGRTGPVQGPPSSAEPTARRERRNSAWNQARGAIGVKSANICDASATVASGT